MMQVEIAGADEGMHADDDDLAVVETLQHVKEKYELLQ